MNKSLWIRKTKWYKSTLTGKFIWDFEITHLSDLLIEKESLVEFKSLLEVLLADGFLVPVNPPTVIDLLKQNRFAAAARRYEDIHGTTLSETHKMLKLIQEDMEKYESRN